MAVITAIFLIIIAINISAFTIATVITEIFVCKTLAVLSAEEKEKPMNKNVMLSMYA